MPDKVQTSTAKAIISILERHGVDTVFGLPGVQLDALFNAFYQARNSIRMVHTRHEQTTAYMANGYALSTGKLGVCTMVPGAGLLNAGAALATGYSQNAPVLCITGQIPSKYLGLGLGALHEIDDQLDCVANYTKWRGTIGAPEDVPGVMGEAIRQATSGRNRPVVVEVPPDVLTAEAAPNLDEFDPGFDDPEPGADLIDRAAELLAAAARPVICAGSGAMGATDELRELAEILSAPVIVSQYGPGVADPRHPLTHSLASGIKLWPEADLALGVGTRMATQIMHWGFDDAIKLIRIDADAEQSVAAWPPDVHLVTSSKVGIAKLNAALAGADIKCAWDAGALAAARAEAERESRRDMDMHHGYTDAIRAALPEDGFICFDVTQVGYYASWGFPVYRPRHYIPSGYQGTLGYGFPTALGVKVAHPDAPVVCVAGDGGLMFDIQELATAVQHNINLVTVVFNDQGFGNVRRGQKLGYDGQYIASDLHNPDFIALAEAFGARGMRAGGPEELQSALKKAFDAGAPVLIEVPVGEFPPWLKFVPRRQVRGSTSP